MLKSKNILPINPQPCVRNSAHNAFMDAIITNEKAWGDLKADISLPYENIEQWSIVAENAIIKNTDDRFEVFHSPTVQEQKKYIFRKFNSFDELMLKINYQQFTSYWDSICIFVHDKIYEFDRFTNSHYFFGRFCNNDFFTKDGPIEREFNLVAKNHTKVWLKVTNYENVLTSSFSVDGIEWIEAHSSSITSDNEKYIGIAFALNDNVYYNWLSNNFIQIRYNKNEAFPIDYVTYLKQNSKPFVVHPFLKMNEESWEDICQYNLSFSELIQSSINSNKYIVMWLNEFYLPASKAYLKQISIHECLIYGYEKSNIYMMIISDGKPKCITADIDDVLCAWNNSDKSAPLFFLKYSPTYSLYNLEINHIYQELVAFLQCKNTSLLYTHLVAFEDGVFGIDVYHEFVNNRECFNHLLSDLRISYLLYEHNLIMKQRLEFLFTVISATPNAMNCINELVNRLVTNSLIAMRLTIKNFYKRTEATEKEILLYYTKIYNDEEILYQNLIDVILPYVDKTSL